MIWQRYKFALPLFCGLCTLSYFGWNAYHQSAELAPKIVDAVVVSLHDIQRTETFIGTIQAKRSTILAAKVRGILDIVTQAGQQVKKDDVLAHIIDTHGDQTYQLALEKEQLAKTQYDRAMLLHQQGSLSKNALEEKKNAWLDASKNKVDAQKSRSHTLLEVPFNGVVGIFKAQEGSLVNENDAIVSVFDPTTLKVSFDIPLEILSYLQDGTTVFIGGKTYALTHVQRMLDPSTHMCPAYVNLDGNDFTIGSTLDVNVVVEEAKNVIVIPHAAIFMKEGKTCVYIIEETRAKLTEVTCGMRNRDVIAIKEGLKTGDTIISNAPTRIYPGMPVRINKQVSAS